MITAKLTGGKVSLTDRSLVFTFRGRPDNGQSNRKPHRVPLDDVNVIEVKPPRWWQAGQVRFGTKPLGDSRWSFDQLDWLSYNERDQGYPYLLEIAASISEQRGIANPFAVSQKDQRSNAPRPLRSPTEKRVRTFNIHALGPSGSGKTVFLASMYARLRLRRPDLAFYLKSDHKTSLALNSIYNQIANPHEAWPEASQAVNEWHFRTCVSSPSGDFEPLEFVYLDYPGGALTNPRAMQDAGIQELVGRLRSANALLVLLDGQAMLSLLRDERAGHRYMEFDLTSSLEIAQQSRCPVHFAVTKWDLLYDRYTLADVRSCLMENENFANLVEAKSEDMPGTIRLIPISAVGFGFAELQPSGEMRKIGDSPRPHQVDLPLLSVFPDFFHFAFEELKSAASDLPEIKQAQAVQRFLNPASTSKLKGALRDAAKKVMPLMQDSLLRRKPALASILSAGGDWVIDDVLNFAERLLVSRAERVERGRAQYAAELMKTRHQLNSEGAALELLERQCERIVSDFEIEHPESVLAGGLDSFEPDERWAESLRVDAAAASS